jgi:uncharacterized integral membrane protein
MTRDRDQRQQAAEYPEVEGPGVLDRVRLGIGIVGALLLVLFLLQNLQDAEINFLWFTWDMPMVFALVASAVLGALAWGIVGFFRRRSQDSALRARIEAEHARKR